MGESHHAYLSTFRPASASHSSETWSTARLGPAGRAVPTRFRTPTIRSGITRSYLDPPPPVSVCSRGGVMYRVSSLWCVSHAP